MEQSAMRPPHLHQWDIRDARDLPLPCNTLITQNHKEKLQMYAH